MASRCLLAAISLLIRFSNWSQIDRLSGAALEPGRAVQCERTQIRAPLDQLVRSRHDEASNRVAERAPVVFRSEKFPPFSLAADTRILSTYPERCQGETRRAMPRHETVTEQAPFSERTGCPACRGLP